MQRPRPGRGNVGGLAVEMAVQIVQAEVQEELEEGKSKSPEDSETSPDPRVTADWSQTCQTVPRFDNSCLRLRVVDSFLGEDAPAGGDPSSAMGSGIDFITGVCCIRKRFPSSQDSQTSFGRHRKRQAT